MAEPPNNHPADGQLTPEQIVDLMAEQILQDLMLLPGIVPGVGEDALRQLAPIMAREQLQIMQQILPSILNPGSKPMLVLELRDGAGESVVIAAQKQLGHTRELRQVMQHALVLAFILNPLARSVLRALGFTYQFAESVAAPQPPPQKKIILTG